MSRIAVGTIFAKNYLAQARTFAKSFRKWHPEIPLFGLLADDCDGYFAPDNEPFRFVELDQLDFPDLPRRRFLSSRQQLSVLAKPYLIQYLLDRGFQSVLLLDPDVWVLNRLDSLRDVVHRHSVVLTPHLVNPPSAANRISRELNILVSGSYNGGCLGVSDTFSARQFLSWLQERLLTHCRHAVAEGIYYDQRWLDLVPVYFDDVHICRDWGVNVAYWNLAERPLEKSEHGYSAQGEPVRFFHFSGFDPEDSDRISKYATEELKNQSPSTRQLRYSYADALFQSGYDQTKKWPYAYDQFDNGAPIPELAKTLYEELERRATLFGDPRRTGPGSFFDWLNETDDKPLGVSRLRRAADDRRSKVPNQGAQGNEGDLDRYWEWLKQHRSEDSGIAPNLPRSPGEIPLVNAQTP